MYLDTTYDLSRSRFQKLDHELETNTNIHAYKRDREHYHAVFAGGKNQQWTASGYKGRSCS